MTARWSVPLLVGLLFILSLGCSARRDPGVVVMVIESSPISLDPRIGTDAQSERIAELIFDSLLRRDSSFTLQPALAERWETVDPLTYVFHLRSGVHFHNGKLLTARDVRYTFESLLSGEIASPKKASYDRIASIDVMDDQTFKITLKEPYASFLWNLTQGAIGIVPEGSGKEFGRALVGSGPFEFVSATPDESVIIRRNPDYWGTAPKIAGVEFHVVPDATTRALELQKGSADIALNSLTADMVAALRKEPDLTVTKAPGTSYQYIGLNLQNPRLTRPVRQAIAYAINRDEMIAYLWKDMVRLANSVLPPEHWAYAPDLVSYRYDPAKAQALLDQVGLAPGPDGVRLTLEMKISTDQTGRELAAVLQDQLSRVGIRLEVKTYEFATFFADVIKGNFDLYSLRWTGANEDPDFFEFCFASDKAPPYGANRGHYSNPEVDHLIAAGRTAPDLEGRRAAYQAIQRILNADLPYIHLWYVDNVAVHNKRLSNLNLFPSGNYDFLTEIEAGPIRNP
jgi:ABC-type transport system substrate-binding protein